MSDDQDKTLKELSDEREFRDQLGIDTDDLDEQREEKENQQELLARRARLAEAVREDSLPPHTREAYEDEIGEIDDLLAKPIEAEIEEKRAEADEVRKMMRAFGPSGFDRDARPDGWEDAYADADEKIGKLEAEADDLERKLNGESAELSASGAESESKSQALLSRGKVKTSRLLDAWDIDREELDDEIAKKKRTAESFYDDGMESMAASLSTKTAALKAAANGDTWWEPADQYERHQAELWNLTARK